MKLDDPRLRVIVFASRAENVANMRFASAAIRKLIIEKAHPTRAQVYMYDALWTWVVPRLWSASFVFPEGLDGDGLSKLHNSITACVTHRSWCEDLDNLRRQQNHLVRPFVRLPVFIYVNGRSQSLTER